ncbi:hypothetical protein BDY24DRAFT_399646 [Mrakia frigida]|uniref:uncharacterized protein n=1 Tax=Mrakia frigida TaxID=29902 RepID=UPI003FCC1B33
MSSTILRRAAPTLRSASSSARAPVGRRFAAHAVEINPTAPWNPKTDISWALPAAAVFVPLIGYYTNELYHSTLFSGAAHGGHDSRGHVDASHAEVAHTDNTFTKGTPKNAQKAKVADESPEGTEEEVEAAEPRSEKGPDEKTVLSDNDSSSSDPVAEKSPEQAEGKAAPKSVEETSEEKAAPVEEKSEEKEEAAPVEKEDEKKAAEPEAEEEKEVVASTAQALQADGDPLAAKAHEEESSS